MPNWCYNHFSMTKKDYLANKHLFMVVEDGETKIDFSILLPHDPSVRADLYYDNCSFGGGLLTNNTWDRDENHPPFPCLFSNSFDDLTEDFFTDCLGERQKLVNTTNWNEHDGWYQWRCNHWGTKWNGGTADINEDLDELEDDDMVNINFQTAWSCPEPFFQELAKHCSFYCDGEEECRSFTYEGYVEDNELVISYDDDPEPEEDDEDLEE